MKIGVNYYPEYWDREHESLLNIQTAGGNIELKPFGVEIIKLLSY